MGNRFTERFSFKISIILIIVLVFSLILNLLLNFFNFEKTYGDLVSSRFYVAGKDIKNTIEYQLNLGLALPEMKNIQVFAEEQKKKDAAIAEVEVCDEKGRILFGTDSGRLGKTESPSLIAAMRKHDHVSKSKKTEERTSTVVLGDRAYIILPIVNSFGLRVGSVALAYPRTIISRPMQGILIYLLVLFIVTLLLFSAITFAAVHLISRSLNHKIVGMNESLKGLLARRESAALPGPHYGMELDFAEFSGTVSRAMDEISDIGERIDSTGKDAKPAGRGAKTAGKSAKPAGKGAKKHARKK